MAKKEFLKTSWSKRVISLKHGTGPVGRKSCTGVVRSDLLYTFRLGGGQGQHKSNGFWKQGFQDLKGLDVREMSFITV